MRKRALGLAVALVVGAFIVSASGAATTKAQKSSKIDVSTRAAVIHYLRSIHVSAKHVVIQRGLRNYAGAHCPGKHWTCAGTKHTVVQIAKRGGLNRYACTTAKCAVVQIGGASRGLRAASQAGKPKPPPPDYALCVKTTGVTQTCTINQPNATGLNKAVVWMVTPKQTGLTQSSSYVATITQGPASTTGSTSNTNLACVKQSVWLDASTTKTNTASTTVTNDNHELIAINQNSTSGTNTVEGVVDPTHSTNGSYDCDTSATSTLTQDELLTSIVNSKGSITQKQNTSTATFTNPLTGLPVANVVTDVEQNQGTGFLGFASGLNNANFAQSSTQVAVANTPKGTVTQQQDANVPNPPYSGMVGTINQDSSAQSTAVVKQDETQCQDAVSVGTIAAPTTPASAVCPAAGDTGVPSGVLPNLTQTQYGPEGVLSPATNNAGPVHYYRKGYGQSQQTGAGLGVQDSFKLTQTSHQSADLTANQNQLIQGDCTSSGDNSSSGGSCDASQSAVVNGSPIADGYTAGAIGGSSTNPPLVITCTNGNNNCHATPPPAPQLTGTPDNPSESTSATFTWTEAATAGVTLKCSIDGGTTFTTCDSATTTSYSGLSLGSHTFEVKAVDNTASHNESAPASFTWTIVPYLTFQATGDGTSADGASAGWTGGVPGSSIDLTVSSNPADFFTTFAQIALHNFEGIAVGDLVGAPTFVTNNYNAGSPRYVITLDNSDSLWGYPPNSGLNGSNFAWAINNGNTYQSWSDVQSAESTAKVTGVYIIADGESAGTTDVISAFSFDGYSLSDFTNHWHSQT